MRTKTALIALLLAAASASAAERLPSDPAADPTMVAAGFLDHHPDLRFRLSGIEAFKRKDYAKAMASFQRAAYYADKPSQAMVAEMMWNGEGATADRAMAYAWMDLAAERGYQSLLALREKYWNELSEDERRRALDVGRDVYAKYGDDVAKPRYALQLRRGLKQATGSHLGGAAGANLRIYLPGEFGEEGDGVSIDGSRFYDPHFWKPDQYWAYADSLWKRRVEGKVTVGDVEQAGNDVGAKRDAGKPPRPAR